MIDVDAYLKRIAYAGALEPTLGTLRALHRAHLYSVPFENLDIHLGRPIVLDEAALHRKVVGERRGGFCYELNGLFAALLRALGFEVTMLEAGVRKADGGFGPPFDHLVLAVRGPGGDAADGRRWLVDVGFGESFLDPLRFAAGQEQRQDTGAYRIDAVDGEYVLRRRAVEGGPWDAEHRFRDRPHVLGDFAGMCVYHQRSPESPFTKGRVCTLPTPDGRVTMRDNRLIITRHGRRSEQPVSGEATFRAALRAHFGIDLPAGR
jgi:N-hydroxyarylamine O-acetyltransferase